MNKQPIGVFDSGIGGLTILRALHQVLPGEDLIYFGDTANVPYGGKSKQAVTRLSLAVAQFLESCHVKLVIVACNTASAQALGTLKKQLSVPVMGVIEPGAATAIRTTKNHKIAVLGTQGTVESNAYVKAIHKQDKQVTVFQKACPLFVPLVEEGFARKPAAELIAREYLQSIQNSQADTVILGCTHYPILKPLITSILGPKIALVDSADTLAQSAKDFLEKHQLTASSTGSGTIKLYASDSADKFTTAAKQLLGLKLHKATLKKLNI